MTDNSATDSASKGNADIEFIFDFGSPNAYLAHKALPPLLERTGARVRYNPCLLGGVFKATNNQSPIYASANIKGKLAYEQLEIARFIAKHNIAFTFNPDFPINTLLIMRGAIAAQQRDQLAKYVDAVFDAMWVTPKKMDDPAIIAEALTDAGLDGAALVAATADPQVKAALIRNTEHAVERGVFGMPAFFVKGEMYFGKDRLGQIEEALTT